MRTIFTLIFLTVFTFSVSAQLAAPIDFEVGTDDDFWTLFANGTDSPDDITVVANPNANDVNSSDNCLEFIVHDNASTWVGAWSDNYGPIAFAEDANVLTMMVLKTIISPVGLKVESSTDGGPITEVMVDNTLTDEWELLAFDFTGVIGFSYGRLVFFPDFPASRTGGTTAYIDNISNEGLTSIKNLKGSSIKTYPNPVDEVMYVQHPEMNGITISSLTGKTIKSFKFPTASTRNLEIGDLPTGMYLITVNSKGGTFASKFVKK